MNDLHARLKAVIEERLRVARQAADGCARERLTFDLGWPRSAAKDAYAAHAHLNSPADAVLAAEHALGVLERHSAIDMAPPVACRTCCDRHESNYQLGPPRSMDVAWPCDEIRGLLPCGTG